MVGGRNSRSDRRSPWLVKEHEPAGQVLLAPDPRRGKKEPVFLGSPFFQFVATKGTVFARRALSHTSLSSRPNSGKVTRCTPFSNLPGVGVAPHLAPLSSSSTSSSFLSSSLCLFLFFFTFFFHFTVEHDTHRSTFESNSTPPMGSSCVCERIFDAWRRVVRVSCLRGGERAARMARGFPSRVTLTRNRRQFICISRFGIVRWLDT